MKAMLFDAGKDACKDCFFSTAHLIITIIVSEYIVFLN